MEIARTNNHLYKAEAVKRQETMISKDDFTQIYDTYSKRVYNYICYRINNHYTAEDICSGVFETVIAKYHLYEPAKSKFDVWLFAIVRNAVTDYFRRSSKRAHFSLDALLHFVWPKPSPEELAIREDNHQALFQALAKLRDKERNVIAMKYAAGLKNTEIADVLGVSESQIGVVLYRSLKKLHKAMEAGGFSHE